MVRLDHSDHCPRVKISASCSRPESGSDMEWRRACMAALWQNKSVVGKRFRHSTRKLCARPTSVMLGPRRGVATKGRHATEWSEGSRQKSPPTTAFMAGPNGRERTDSIGPTGRGRLAAVDKNSDVWFRFSRPQNRTFGFARHGPILATAVQIYRPRTLADISCTLFFSVGNCFDCQLFDQSMIRSNVPPMINCTSA